MKMHMFARSIIGLLCLLAEGTLNAQATFSPAEKEVWLRELKQVEFMNAGDIDGFLGLLHEDFLGWSRNDPKPSTKEERRKALRALLNDGRLVRQMPVREPLAIRIYGDVAIVYYRERDTRPDSSGKEAYYSVRTTHTWKRTADDWRLIGGMSAVEASTSGVVSRRPGHNDSSIPAAVKTIPAGTAFAPIRPAIIGIWKLNVTKSKWDSGPLPWRSITVKVEQVGDAERRIIEAVRADGTMETQTVTFKYDGKDYPRTGSPNIDAMAFKRIDAYRWEITSKKAGKVVGNAVEVLSGDGKVWSSAITQARAKDGVILQGLQVFDKQ